MGHPTVNNAYTTSRQRTTTTMTRAAYIHSKLLRLVDEDRSYAFAILEGDYLYIDMKPRVIGREAENLLRRVFPHQKKEVQQDIISLI